MFNWENNVTPLNDTNLNQAQRDLKSEILLACYPVGSYYWSSESTDPSTLFGGTWERVKDTFVYALGDSGSAGDTGGASSRTIAETNLPKLGGSFIMHSGGEATNIAQVTGKFTAGIKNANAYKSGGVTSTGANSVGRVDLNYGRDNPTALNIMPPYIKAYCFKRTA